jgi:Anthrone oxygenase
MITGLLALTVAAMFTGAAFYVGFAEQPARLQLDDRALLAEWKPSYSRGFAMQATLAVVGFLLGMLQWWQSGNGLWFAGALLLVANWPFTLFVIMPTNKALLATASDAAGARSRELVVKWGRLHAVRTALGATAALVFLWAAT